MEKTNKGKQLTAIGTGMTILGVLFICASKMNLGAPLFLGGLIVFVIGRLKT